MKDRAKAGTWTPPWVEREVLAGYLLDVAGAWNWLSGESAALPRVPAVIGGITADDEARLARLVAGLPRLRRDPARPLIWVRSDAELADALKDLRTEAVIGLDVETTLNRRTMCLVQLAGARATYVVDALELSDIQQLGAVLSDPAVTKLIHYA
jgi:ATP-dependent Lhr-like helicase